MNLVGEDTIPLDKMKSMSRLELEGLISKGLLRGPEAFDIYLGVSATEAEDVANELDKLGAEMGIAPDKARINRYYAIFLRTLIGDKSEEGIKLRVGLVQDRVTTLEKIKYKLGSERSEEVEEIETEMDSWRELERSLLPEKE